MSYAPYNEDTASTEDRIAWALCQIIDDDAPMRWTRYRSAAVCIARNPELMADLRSLAADGVPASEVPSADYDGIAAIRQRLQNSVNWMMEGRNTGPGAGVADYKALIRLIDGNAGVSAPGQHTPGTDPSGSAG